MRTGKLSAYDFRATVKGRVVYDDDLKVDPSCVCVDAPQALSHEVRRIPIDDDDRKIDCARHDDFGG